jgi:antitoxin StbD
MTKTDTAESIQELLADASISISEFKKNPMAAVESAEGFPVVVLNHNKPVFYCVPAASYETLMDKLEDQELNAIADARMGQKVVKVDINGL